MSYYHIARANSHIKTDWVKWHKDRDFFNKCRDNCWEYSFIYNGYSHEIRNGDLLSVNFIGCAKCTIKKECENRNK